MTNSRSIHAAIVLVLVTALLAALPGPAVAASSEERRLAATRAKIAQIRKQIDTVEDRRAGRAAALAEAERQVAAVLDAVASAEAAVQRQAEAVTNAEAQLERLQVQEAVQQAAVRGRTVTLYKHGNAVPLNGMLDAATTRDALRRTALLDILDRTDRRRFEHLKISQVATAAQRKTLEAERAVLARVADQQRAILADVEELRQHRALALGGVNEELQQLQVQERHLESESRKIAALARRSSRSVASRGGGAVAAGPVVGGWTWPVRGRVTSEYGRRWGRAHEGIDIGAPTGTTIVAARGGRVTYTGRMSGYGLLTLVDHGGGIVTAYAHQTRFGARTGDAVSAGQPIGYVGCTGSCTGPHLHFEVRVNGSPRNPRNYLP